LSFDYHAPYNNGVSNKSKKTQPINKNRKYKSKNYMVKINLINIIDLKIDNKK